MTWAKTVLGAGIGPRCRSRSAGKRDLDIDHIVFHLQISNNQAFMVQVDSNSRTAVMHNTHFFRFAFRFNQQVAPVYAALLVMQTQAQQTITAIEAVFTPGSSFDVIHVAPTGSGNFAANTNISLEFNGQRMGLSGYEAASQRFVPLAVVGEVFLRRNSVGQSNNIVWYRGTREGTTAFSLEGTWDGSMESVFANFDLNRGTDNLFANTGDSNGNNNNIERVDVIFIEGLTADPDLAFAVFERGTVSAHDSFGIAAITALDGDGNPSAYAPLLIVSNWGTTNLGTLNTLVERNQASDPNGLAQHPSAWVEQALGGVSVWIENDLGVTSGSTFYGYSLFGGDVTSSLDLVNYQAFPTNTSSSQGGIDLTSFNGVLYRAVVPEPTVTLLAGLGALATLRRRREQEGRNVNKHRP